VSDRTKVWTFGGILREQRLKERMTLRKAAKYLNIDPGNLSRLERSHFPPPRKRSEIERIAGLYRTSQPMLQILVDMALQHHIAVLQKEFDQ
jgi:transcriptional regulator with XRE-family HTH domain